MGTHPCSVRTSEGEEGADSSQANTQNQPLRDYLTYYHRYRTHLSLEKDAPEPRPVERSDHGAIVEMPVVGGLHHRYTRLAA